MFINLKPIKKLWNLNLKRFLIILIVFSLAFLTDFLTKKYLFSEIDYEIGNEYNYIIFGIRSVKNFSTTFFNFWEKITGSNVSKTFLISFSFIIGFIFVFILIFFIKKINLSIAFSFIIAGIVGNSTDFIFVGFVKDILYLPWIDRGTFNFADLFTLLGLGWFLISLIKNIFTKNFEEVNLV